MKRNLTFVMVSLGLLSAGVMPAAAGQRAGGDNSSGSLTACSRYGNGCYTAGLRRGDGGRQLVLRHGTRIDCGRDCRGTLREATVDFWDTMRENGG